MKNFLSIILTTLFLASCSSSTKIVKFSKLPDETYANDNLKSFFKTNRVPNIVLRTPNNNDKATSNTSTSKNTDVLYNAIEKELLKNGFSVRDRGLFNELLSKSQTNDYSKIQDLTNTDVILEVVNIDPSVLYTTNKVTSIGKKGETEQVGEIEYKNLGASAEYKIILVKNNEIAGTYKFNYQPCPSGCPLNTFSFSGKNRNRTIQVKETVEINTMAEFMKITTQKLIESFKQ